MLFLFIQIFKICFSSL